ncbi:unnamed protein product [Polarella glacialis]|uniref:Uncharacterized protein n=1 Tax=Polarella glacialis TaxID=89957 RepID=A0A813JVC1_POLGL|nr:unnamed protein product [Polarella glacialis]
MRDLHDELNDLLPKQVLDDIDRIPGEANQMVHDSQEAAESWMTRVARAAKEKAAAMRSWAADRLHQAEEKLRDMEANRRNMSHHATNATKAANNATAVVGPAEPAAAVGPAIPEPLRSFSAPCRRLPSCSWLWLLSACLLITVA